MDLIDSLLRAMLSETGVLSAILFIEVVYLTIQLGKNREDKDKLHEQVLQLATNQVAVTKDVQNVLEKVIELMPARGGKDV